MKENLQENGRKYAQVPTEGKWFKVNPLTIDQNLFKERRNDIEQEMTRRCILEAFEEMKKNPQYAKPFKTMIVKKTWSYCKTPTELKELAKSVGDHMADWVEQALEWAQRISNGETWEDICNKEDPVKYARTVVWNDRKVTLVGGGYTNMRFPTVIDLVTYYEDTPLYNVVPLVVAYDE